MASVAVGLEISQRMIRLVHLKRGRKGPTLVGKSKAAVPEGVISEAEIADTVAFKGIVSDLFAEASVGRGNVCISMVSERVDIRTLQLPRMPEKDLNQTIQWELERLVRFDDAIFFDHQALQEGDGEGGARDLLVVAAPRSLVYGYLLPFQSLGYHPEILDIGGFSLPLSCPREGAVGYLVLGPQLLHLLFYQDGVYKLSRLIPADMKPIFSLPLSNDDGVSDLDAVLMAEEGGMGPVGQAVQDLSRTLIQTLEGATSLGELDTLVVAGEGALVDGITQFIEEESGIRTIVADPMIGPGDEGVLGEEAAAYAIAVGLAQRGLDEL